MNELDALDRALMERQREIIIEQREKITALEQQLAEAQRAAKVEEAIRNMPDGGSIEHTHGDILEYEWRCFNFYDDSPETSYYGATLDAALIAAGLLPAENKELKK